MIAHGKSGLSKRMCRGITAVPKQKVMKEATRQDLRHLLRPILKTTAIDETTKNILCSVAYYSSPAA